MTILKGVKSEIDVIVKAEILGDNSQVTTVGFTATYRKLKVSEVQALMARAPRYQAGDDDYLRREAEFRRDSITENLLGWHSVPTTTGEEFAFTPENLGEMLEVPEYRAALWNGLMVAMSGKAALEKN
jgi:hypothetical protein